jgi:hypothetical protein
VRNDKDVEKVVAENNSKMFNPSKVYFDGRFGKMALQKELARRTAVQCPGEHERVRKCENWTRVTLIEEMKKQRHS